MTAPIFDASVLARLNIRVAPGQTPLPVRTAQLYMDTSQKVVAALVAALKVDQSVDQLANPTDGVRMSAHTLKSSSAIVGALALSELARELEAAAVAKRLINPQQSAQQAQDLFDQSCDALRRYIDNYPKPSQG